MAKNGKIAIPGTAVLLAGGYLAAAMVLPVLLPVVAGAAALTACALVLTRRVHRRLIQVLQAVAMWLGVGFAGAWMLGAHPLAGLAWALAALFLLPLPIIPWLYARTHALPPPTLQGGGQ